MGMTDSQWKSHLRALIAELEEALEENPNSNKLKKMIARLRLDLESQPKKGAMALETKMMLAGMAQFAIATKNKGMYDYAAALASTENLILTPYPENEETPRS